MENEGQCVLIFKEKIAIYLTEFSIVWSGDR